MSEFYVLCNETIRKMRRKAIQSQLYALLQQLQHAHAQQQQQPQPPGSNSSEQPAGLTPPLPKAPFCMLIPFHVLRNVDMFSPPLAFPVTLLYFTNINFTVFDLLFTMSGSTF
jgi:hypothetical protein